MPEMMNMTKLEGEELYANAFRFFEFVPANEREELRDFLYKFAHNFQDAKEYLRLLEQLSLIEDKNSSSLIFLTQSMALQCFPLAIRRIADKSSKRSIQRLINKTLRDEHKHSAVVRVQEIINHYKQYLDKGVAHQDEYSIKEILELFPDSDVINQDMAYLESFYFKLTKELCSHYIDISRPATDFNSELKKLTT